jgi:hypothetical protein
MASSATFISMVVNKKGYGVYSFDGGSSPSVRLGSSASTNAPITRTGLSVSIQSSRHSGKSVA